MTKESVPIVKIETPACFRGETATAFRVPDRSGGTRMVTMGAGENGIVFAPISWGDACEWASEAKRLAGAGHRVVTFDWGPDRQQTVATATRLLRGQGAKNIAWVGGCMGGNVMLGMAAETAHRPVGVAGISPLSSLGGMNAKAAEYPGELFLLGTVDDPLVGRDRLREVGELFPRAQLTLLPGREHAAEIFAGPHLEPARASLNHFLTRAFSAGADAVNPP